jgi:hypothetical protein
LRIDGPPGTDGSQGSRRDASRTTGRKPRRINRYRATETAALSTLC